MQPNLNEDPENTKDKPTEDQNADIDSAESITPEANESHDSPSAEVPERPEPEKPTPDVSTAKPASGRKKTIIIASTAAVLVIAAAAAAWYVLQGRKPAVSNAQTVQNTQQTQKESEDDSISAELKAQITKFTTPTTGETWLATPKEVKSLGYVEQNVESDTTYYEMGARGQNTVYLSNTLQAGQDVRLYEKAPDGTVHIIMRPNANASYNATYEQDVEKFLPKSVIPDTTTHYDSLSPPTTFALGQGQEAKAGAHGYLTETLGVFTLGSDNDKSVKETAVKTYGASKLLKVERTYADTGLTAINYVVETPIHARINLVYSGIGTDLRAYTWDNGVAVADSKDDNNYTIDAIVRGCGASGAISRADKVTDSDFVAAGKTADGKTVYAFKDNNAALVAKTYAEYKDYFQGSTNVTIVSLSDFVKQHALVAYKNQAGEWLIYTLNKFAAIGGCAKPVVYLYPTKAQNVTVRVGANVTVSDPLYNPGTGWTAYAEPSGKLTVGGAAYSSLFWEGQGYGMYPGITTGTVVKHGDAAATIKQQLARQGLSQAEINDFMAYWQSKIPAKPYIRLTWLNTAQMNQLAPLYVSPKPDTTIRVFLDMAGYDVPPNLAAQNLSAVPRTGFTVVEWGGLTASPNIR